MYQTVSPILLLTFNRLDHTLKVFDAVKKVKPSKLYIANDGPREGNERDQVNTKAIRETLTEKVDWDCEIKVLFRDENWGCRRSVSDAINWFFHHEEKGIILEDDCLPETSFFQYCDELLALYNDNNEIGAISGHGVYGEWHSDKKSSYAVVNYPLIWGWASWRRVWNQYDVDLAFAKNTEIRDFEGLNQSSKATIRFWSEKASQITSIDTWDYQLSLMFLKEGLKCLVPKVNLIENIGFDQASHKQNAFLTGIPVKSMTFPLVHPKSLEIDQRIRNVLESQEYFQYTVPKRLFNKFLKLVNHE